MKRLTLSALFALIAGFMMLTTAQPAAAAVQCYGVVSGVPNPPYPVDATNNTTDSGTFVNVLLRLRQQIRRQESTP